MKKKLFVTLILNLLMIGGMFAQQRTVRGTVTALSDGQPLPGVTVAVQGTANIGTITDADGKYSIKLPEGANSLMFSFVGMETKSVNIGGSNVIDIALEESTKALEEVVVTALGVERQAKALGYSVQAVHTEQLTEAREVNVVNSLKGKIAGVYINNSSSGGAGGATYITIRGASSLKGDNRPLFVVDGVPIDNQVQDQPNSFDGFDYGDGIGNINPDNIESMSVLKGPAAAAMYGARGANGVILITTKSGKKGKRMGVEFNSNFTMENNNVNPTFQNVWGGGYDDNYLSFGKKTVDGKEVAVWPAWLIDHWGGKMDGRPILYEAAPEWGVQALSPQPADNIAKFYRTGTTLTNTLSVSGGSEKSSVRLSVSDMRNKSIVPHSSLDRQTISLRASSQVSEKIFVDAKVDYIRQSGENRVQNGAQLMNLPSTLKIWPRSLSLEVAKQYEREDGRMLNYRNAAPFNPYWLTEKFKNNDTRDRIMGMARVKYDFTRWLNIQLRAGTDFYTDRRFAMIPQGTPGLNYIDGQVKNTTWNVREENSDVLLTASGDLVKNLTGSLSLGANHLNKEREVLEVRGQNLSVPGVYHIRYASQVFPRNYLERKKMNSVYFAGQLAYKNYLFVDVTGRNDWSSTLGLKDQSFFYPSVTSGFVFTDALGMNSGILSFGKLRASYAQAGNDAGPYQTKAGYTYSEISFNGLPMAQIDSRIPLLDLKNELTTSYEFGTDLRFFRNRLAVDFTYYDQSTSNQIINIGVTDATGFSTRTINAGEIQNKGMELLVNATVVKAGDFAWDMTLNLSRNRSKVVSLAEGIETLSLGAKIEARAGEAYGNIIGYRVLRNSAGQVVVNPKNGQVQKGKQPEILGNIQPDALGGLTNTFTYKGISVSALLDIRIGGEIYSNSKYDQMAKGTGKFTENRDPEHMIIDGVIEDAGGDIVVDGVTYRKNDVKLLAQSFYAGSGPWGGIDEPMVLGADYLTLREVTIGYVLPSAILKYTPFASAKLSIVGRNLFYLYRDPEFKEMGISPETAFNTEAYAQGYETAGLPTTRSFGFNLNLSF